MARHVLSQLSLNGQGMIDCLMEELKALRKTEDNGLRELTRIKRELEQQINRKDRALEAWMDGVINREDMTRLVSRCEKEMARLHDRAEKLERDRASAQQDEQRFQEIRALLEQELEGGDAVLDELIRRITVNQDDFLVEVAEFPVRFRVKAVGEGTGKNYHIKIQECTPILEREMT